MNNGRPHPPDNEHRLVSLDPRDLADLRRLVGKLQPEDRAAATEPKREPAVAPGEKDSDLLRQRAVTILDNRRKRSAIFGRQMFAEPAWEMILVLYIDDRGRRHTQSSLAEVSGGSRSTGMRWIDYLLNEDLIIRDDHPTDKRRHIVQLSAKGRELVELYLSETSRA